MSNNVILDSNLELARGFFEVGNLTYFSATDSSTGDEILYKSDGTPGGTTAVKNIEPGNYVGINSLSYVNSKLIFIATNLLSGTELWASDGTAIGTIMIKEFTAGAASSSFLSASKEPLGTKTFFVVDDGINGFELWVTDGTAVGTQLLKDINPGAAGSFPNDFVKIGSYVYFSAETAANGRELWRTDGTSMGTVMVVDLVPGAGSSSPEKITAFGTKLIFTAKDALGDREVHIYEP
jgi:ELWxxDGT repeat protein